MKAKEKYTGVILAGGKSSRMGTDKGLIVFNGITFVETILQTLRPLVSEVMISSSNPEYLKFGVKLIPDEVKDSGPLAGICATLRVSSYERILVLSCDIPLIRKDVLVKLLEEMNDDSDALVPVLKGVPQPLCAIYRKSCLRVFSAELTAGRFKMKEVLKKIKVHSLILDREPLAEASFTNINTPAELEQAQYHFV